MEVNNRFIIISRNSLQTFSLRALCKDYLLVSSVLVYETVEEMLKSGEEADLLFVDAPTWVHHATLLQPLTGKTVVLVDDVPTKAQVFMHDTHMVIPLSTNYHEIGNFLKQYWDGQARKKKVKEEKELSDREKEVLKLVCTGKLNKEIADELNISMHTVISHRKNICAKLNIKSVPALTIYAVLNGIIPKEEIE